MSVTFNHTGITVKDLDHSIAMFEELFGLEMISRAPRDPAVISRIIGVPGARVEVAYMRGANTTLELLCYSSPDDCTIYWPRPCDLGSLHLAFNVPDMPLALEKTARFNLELMGEVVVIDAGPNKGSMIAYLRSPLDGLIIEIIQSTAGT